ncbi:MAG: citramalate synthase [Deltaproteobacteria bacterium]|nr:citramalate synthase [Deltaproteobacteria bacterium]MBZ0219999.1 citramalate synthase [Deltaproteobacteria bacterium]
MIFLYDTTLRDGTQAEDISFSVEDKIRIAKALDDLGVHYIEGGWPGSNPRDIEFFKSMAGEKLGNSKLVSFGSTRRAGVKASVDANLKALVSSRTPAVTIFGKTWKLHVLKAIRVSLDENIEMIFDSVAYLKKRVDEVFYDAEHFFDAYKDDPAYALKTLKAAKEAGADVLVLCDTNGGTLPFEVAEITREVRLNTSARIGIHAHNDSDTAVASSLSAVREGAVMVQGTVNGFGERCGNANLCSIIPALKVKMGLDCIGAEKLKKLRNTARFVNELANLPHLKHQPYVGDSAFAHKGGIHVSAILKNPATYEHMSPDLVGNIQRVLVSDLSGRSNIIYKAEEYGVDISSGSEVVKGVLNELKLLEHHGFQYEGAEASFELLIQKALKKKERYFKLLDFRVIDEKRSEDEAPHSEATIKLEVNGVVEHTAAEGNGPVNALDRALRKALERFYPSIRDVELLDFKVRVLAGMQGTAAKVRVLVESGDGADKWGTVGVSENVIEASWQAIVDSLEYKLFKDGKKRKGKPRA